MEGSRRAQLHSPAKTTWASLFSNPLYSRYYLAGAVGQISGNKQEPLERQESPEPLEGLFNEQRTTIWRTLFISLTPYSPPISPTPPPSLLHRSVPRVSPRPARRVRAIPPLARNASPKTGSKRTSTSVVRGVDSLAVVDVELVPETLLCRAARDARPANNPWPCLIPPSESPIGWKDIASRRRPLGMGAEPCEVQTSDVYAEVVQNRILEYARARADYMAERARRGI